MFVQFVSTYGAYISMNKISYINICFKGNKSTKEFGLGNVNSLITSELYKRCLIKYRYQSPQGRYFEDFWS